MNVVVEKIVFLHDILNEPGRMSTVGSVSIIDTMELKLGRFQSDYGDAYKLESSIQLNANDMASDNLYVDDLLLAINLNSKRGILSRIAFPWQNNSSTYPIMRAGNITLNDRVQGFTTTIPYPFMAPEPFEENITEAQINRSLTFIQSTNAHMLAFDEDIKKTNIKLALLEYETAMSSFISYIRFKHLFDSLEIVTNYDGIRRESSNFDEYLSQQIDVDTTKIGNWRKLYNRLKHAAENSTDIHAIATFATDLSRNSELLLIREKAAILIQKRIMEVYGIGTESGRV